MKLHLVWSHDFSHGEARHQNNLQAVCLELNITISEQLSNLLWTLALTTVLPRICIIISPKFLDRLLFSGLHYQILHINPYSPSAGSLPVHPTPSDSTSQPPLFTFCWNSHLYSQITPYLPDSSIQTSFHLLLQYNTYSFNSIFNHCNKTFFLSESAVLYSVPKKNTHTHLKPY